MAKCSGEGCRKEVLLPDQFCPDCWNLIPARWRERMIGAEYGSEEYKDAVEASVSFTKER